MEWMSAIVGGITTELVSGNSLIGASVASSATKNNSLRDAIDAINGIFDANEAYEEAKADDHQKYQMIYMKVELVKKKVLCVKQVMLR